MNRLGPDPPERAAPPGPERRKPSSDPTADVLDDVDWEFDPEDELVSPLVSTERYFRDFPWGGEPGT